jgi:S-(hydroxymethyl)glutathione dehydrogenase/alcohol dehydrogenase
MRTKEAHMTMTRAAVLWQAGEPWKIEEVKLDAPRSSEVLVRMEIAGLCHSDEHGRSGDVTMPLPVIGGHEGSGVVEEVGPDIDDLKPGDHVALSFIPSCGRCRWCSIGKQYLCDNGAKLFDFGMISDGRTAHQIVTDDGLVPVGRYAQLGTFSEHILVHRDSVVKVHDDLPFEAVAVVSCGVATGFGSATERASTAPGDTVAVIGVGGVGINAVQGARIAGAERVIAIDPVAFKLEMATSLGATHTFSSMEEARPHINELTWGRMCDRVILSAGVVHGDMIEPALALTSKGGVLVVTGASPLAENDAKLNLLTFSMSNKEIRGTIFGSLNPREAIPRLLSMYRAGSLQLDELVTRRYRLEDVNDGYADMLNGRNIRGVIDFGHTTRK